MAEAAPHYPSFPGTTYSCYEISITRNGSGQYVAAATFLGGTQPALADSGEILIKLDWSTLSSLGGTSSTNVANAAADALLSTTLIPAMGGRPLAQLPLHLIGHSRGGSVVTEMARLLGAQGVWVDQVTTLDPRPVATFGDASVTSYANVLFADNYWQTMGDGLIVPKRPVGFRRLQSQAARSQRRLLLQPQRRASLVSRHDRSRHARHRYAGDDHGHPTRHLVDLAGNGRSGHGFLLQLDRRR